MRRFVVYQTTQGNPVYKETDDGFKLCASCGEGIKPEYDAATRDPLPHSCGNPVPALDHVPVCYHFAMWVKTAPAMVVAKASPDFVSAVPPQSDTCPWGITPDELAALRTGEYAESVYDGQFAEGHPADHVKAHILTHHAWHQDRADAEQHTPEHLGLEG